MRTEQASPTWWVRSGVGAAIAVLVLAVISAGASSYTSAGFGDPGAFTAVLTAVARLVTVLAGSATIGSLIYVLMCTWPQGSGLVGVEGYLTLGVARRWSPVWVAAALAMVICSAANSAGVSLPRMFDTDTVGTLIGASEPPKAWMVVAAGALVVAVGTRVSLSTNTILALTVVAAVAVVAPGVTGNAGEGPGHDLATNAIIVHAIASSVWLGLLYMLLGRRAASAAAWQLAWRRYRVAAAVCWWALAGSGLMLAAQLVTWQQLVQTGYGLLMIGSAAALLLVGLLAMRWRRRVVRDDGSIAAGPRVLRWLGLEVLLLLVAVGASVAMAQRPAAAFLVQPASENQLLIGFDLPHGFSIGRLAGLWRFDVLLGSLALVAAVMYVLGVRKVCRSGSAWPWPRSVAWLAGCVVLLIATSSGVSSYAEATFSAHMAVHLMLNMAVPILWLLGAPVTLARLVLPAAAPGTAPGLREWLARLATSRVVRWLTNPLIAVAVYTVSMFGLYFSPALYVLVLFHWGHQLMNIYFLALGLLFYWPLLGVDPAPHRIPALARIGALLLLMPFDALFGVLVSTTPTVLAANFYNSMTWPWLPHPLSDQRWGGAIAWIAGDLLLLAVLVGLVIQASRRSAGTDPTRSAGTDPYQDLIVTLTQKRG